MNQLTDRQTTRVRDRLRAALALVVLLALVVGLPSTLMAVAPLPVPTAIPAWDGIWQGLVRPDDGSLFVGLLAVVAWLAWAAFAFSVVTELASTMRRVPAPSIPLLGWSQRAAAGLVAASAMLLVSSGPVATAPAAFAAVGYDPQPVNLEAVPVAAGTPGGLSETKHDPGPTAQDPAALSTQGDPPRVTVAHGDTLWSLAEHHLGNGTRYAEIRDLNLGAPQTDGRALSGDHWIYPGWTLQLPADASNLPTGDEEAADTGFREPISPQESMTHVVEPGESLWAIAGDELDDELRYVEIFDANVGRVQGDGRALADSDLIQPGWLLAIPTSPTSNTPSAPLATDDLSPPVPEIAPALPVVPPTPQPTEAPTAEAGLTAQAPPTNETMPQRDPENIDTSEAVPDDMPDASSTSTFATSLFLGLTALAAAGVIGEMTRRRLLHQRVRRTGERIPMPAPASPEQVAETTLRRAPQPVTLTELKDALLALAARCRAEARPLPRVQLIHLTETHIELVLADPEDDPINPFHTTDGRTWTASTRELLATEAIDVDDVAEPYPALVTIGIEADAVLILNLEAVGTLSITGPGNAPVEVARAIAAELLTSELTGRIGLVVGKEIADLAAVSDRVQLQIIDDEDRADQLIGRNAAVARVLEAEGIHDTLAARSTGTAPDVWLPVAFMVTRPETDGVETLGREVPVRVAPWSGSVLITTTAQDQGFEVRIGPEGRAQLEPLGLPFRPQRLTVENYCELVNLLRLGSEPITEDEEEVRDGSRDLEEEFVSALSAVSPEVPVLASHASVFESRDPRAPRVKVLGRVEIDGAPSGGGKRARELITYLALHGPATGPELDEILWSGERVDARTRASLVYRARQWFGRDHLPVVGEDGLYRLSDEVTCDWTEFQEYARRGLTAGADGSDDLAAALRLVRDRPFLGISGTEFIWAETEIQTMIGLIADTAHLLAEVQLRRGQNRAAVETAMIGIRAEPCSETLHRDAVQALVTDGDTARPTELADALYERLHQVDSECTRQEIYRVLNLGRVR